MMQRPSRTGAARSHGFYSQLAGEQPSKDPQPTHSMATRSGSRGNSRAQSRGREDDQGNNAEDTASTPNPPRGVEHNVLLSKYEEQLKRNEAVQQRKLERATAGSSGQAVGSGSAEGARFASDVGASAAPAAAASDYLGGATEPGVPVLPGSSPGTRYDDAEPAMTSESPSLYRQQQFMEQQRRQQQQPTTVIGSGAGSVVINSAMHYSGHHQHHHHHYHQSFCHGETGDGAEGSYEPTQPIDSPQPLHQPPAVPIRAPSYAAAGPTTAAVAPMGGQMPPAGLGYGGEQQQQQRHILTSSL